MWTTWLILQVLLAAIGGFVVLCMAVYTLRLLLHRRHSRPDAEQHVDATQPLVRTRVR